MVAQGVESCEEILNNGEKLQVNSDHFPNACMDLLCMNVGHDPVTYFVFPLTYN